MKKVAEVPAIKEWQFVALISIVSFCFSLAFLDPINWPKQIALFAVAVYLLARTLLRGLYQSRRIRSIELLVFSIVILAWITPQFFSRNDLTRFLWGTFGRNNGFVTQLSLLAIAFVSYRLFLKGFRVEEFLKWSFIAIFSSSIYGLAQFLGFDPIPWSKKNEVFSFFGNTNFASAIFGIGFSIYLVILFGLNGKLSRKLVITYSVMAVSILFVLAQTNSIQGYGGVLITAVLLIMRRIAYWRRLAALIIFIFALPITFLVFLGLAGVGPLGASLFQYTLQLRFYYWLAGIRMGMDHFWTGVGVDSYGDFYRDYRPLDVIAITGPDLTTNNAHNPLIQIFATVGFPGFAIVTTLLLFVAVMAFWVIFKGEGTYDHSSSLAVIFLSAWAMAFISIDNISIAIWNWVLLGAVVGSIFCQKNSISMKKTKESERPYAPFSQLISAIIGIFAFTFAWYSSSPNRDLATTFTKVITSDNSTLINERSSIAVKVANGSMTREAEYAFAADAFSSLGLYDKAIQTLVIGNMKYPRDFQILEKLALLQEKQGLSRELLGTRLRQVELEKNHWRLWHELAREYLNNGNAAVAIGLFPKIESSARLLSTYPKSELERIMLELNIEKK